MLLSAYHKDDSSIFKINDECSSWFCESVSRFKYSSSWTRNKTIFFLMNKQKLGYIRLIITDSFYGNVMSSQTKYSKLRTDSRNIPVRSFGTFTNLDAKAIQQMFPVFKLLARFQKLQKMCRSYGVEVNLDPMYGFDLYSRGILKIEIDRLSEELMLLGNAVTSLDGLLLFRSAYKAPAPFAMDYLNQLYEKADVLAIDISNQDPHGGGASAASMSVSSYFEANTVSLTERFNALKTVRHSLDLNTNCIWFRV